MISSSTSPKEGALGFATDAISVHACAMPCGSVERFTQRHALVYAFVASLRLARPSSIAEEFGKPSPSQRSKVSRPREQSSYRRFRIGYLSLTDIVSLPNSFHSVNVSPA